MFSKMFRNRIYLGIRKYGDEEILDYCEPIIDQQLWDRVQIVNKELALKHGEKNNNNHPRRLGGDFLLSGLLRCKLCGKPMNGTHTQHGKYKKYGYYRCSDYNSAEPKCPNRLIRKEIIERVVIERVLSMFENPDIWNDTCAKFKADLEESTSDLDLAIQAKKQELASNKKEKQKLIDHMLKFEADYGGSKSLYERLHELESGGTEIKEQLGKLEAQKANIVLPQPNLQELRAQYLAAIEQEDPEAIRKGLRSCIKSLTASMSRDRKLSIECEIGLQPKYLAMIPEDQRIQLWRGRLEE